MYGWSTETRIPNSYSKSARSIVSLFIDLIANFLPGIFTFVASLTDPKAPSPSYFWNSYTSLISSLFSLLRIELFVEGKPRIEDYYSKSIYWDDDKGMRDGPSFFGLLLVYQTYLSSSLFAQNHASLDLIFYCIIGFD